jgi:ADP-heptose:LPS heptosyltransferase
VRVGVLKPDHLGDMVLAAPAIAALGRRFNDLTLLCHPKNLGLARHLFPDLRACPMQLPHLDKERSTPLEATARLAILHEIDLLIGLRWDGQCERQLMVPDIEYHTPGPADADVHVTVQHRALVAPFTGYYDILASYDYPGGSGERPRRLGAVGLCVSAGFRLNAWPLNHWLGLAERLHRHGSKIALIGGPAEGARLIILRDALLQTLGYVPRVIAGSNDFAATLQEIASQVDLVVATDSGTAHLAALVRPVVSLFGGSPWRRFAPLGRDNLILCRRVPCSPCVQFHRTLVNTCHTQECLSNLTPEQVYVCLTAYVAGLKVAGLIEVNGVWMAQSPWNETRSANAA